MTKTTVLIVLTAALALAQTSFNTIKVIPTPTHSAVGQVNFYNTAQTQYVGLASPNSLSGNTLFRLPPADGTAAQCLQTDGSANTAFAGCVDSLTGGAGVSVSSPSGSVTITNTGVLSLAGSTYIGVSGSTGAITISGTSSIATAGTSTSSTTTGITVAVMCSPIVVTIPGTYTPACTAVVTDPGHFHTQVN